MARIRTLIADDHPAFLEGLCALLEMKYPEFEVVAVAHDGEEAVKMAAQTDPELAVLDIRMPVMNGVEAAGLIHQRRPDIRIVMLTTFNEKRLVTDALKVGALGYILKETPVDELIGNIRQVYRGNLFVSGGAAQKLVWGDQGEEAAPPARVDRTPTGFENLPKEARFLTARELEVLSLLLKNYSNYWICRELNLSPGTIRNYVSKIYSTLGVADRSSLYVWALDHNL